MSRAFTVNDMIDEVRSLCDEYNTNQLSTADDILPSLRRAQEKAYQTLSRVYPEPILTYQEISGITTAEYTLPENIWEDKILRLEWVYQYGTIMHPTVCQNVPLYVLAAKSRSLQTTPAPDVYSLYGRTLKFNATPNGTRQLRIWYLKEIEPPMLVTGRITHVDTIDTKIYLTEVDADFDPAGSLDNFDHYLNIVDGQTGIVKATMQVLNWDGVDTLTFKTSPDRTSILNRTVSTALTSTICSEDDYVCSIKGSCVLYFMEQVHGFMVQYSVAEIKRKLGYAYDVDQQLIKDFEADLKRAYMGRDSKMRIKHTNPNWLKGARRWLYRGWTRGN